MMLIAVVGCRPDRPTSKFELLPSSETGITFSNDIKETIDFNPLNYLYIYNGAGVGTGDINNDGLPDLFFGGNEVPSRLYLNKGGMTFEDITESAGISKEGWATGISFVDINTDGLMDIYVCIASKEAAKAENKLYINQGNTTFKEEAKAYGLNDSGYSTQVAFFDYDKDGDLDAYVLTNGMESFNHNNLRPIKKNNQGISTDRLYKNNGNNTFTNVSEEAGITIEGYGLGIGILDVNNDGWPDVYCSNDFITNDLLWINNGDGTFTDGIEKYITQTSSNGMGMDIADYNNDGLEDIVQMDMLPESNLHNKTMTPVMNYNGQTLRYDKGYMPQYVRNTLQLRNKDASFSEMGRLAGIHKTDWSWAPLIADLDNDGLKDLFLTNGYGKDITDLDFSNYAVGMNNPFGNDSVRKARIYDNVKKLPTISLANYFYKNEGDLSFKNVTKTWSQGPNSISNGAIYADLDLDGDLDLVSNNINSEAFVYKNLTMENKQQNTRYLAVKLKGPELNPGGIGAEVTLFYGNTIQKTHEYPVRGYVSSVDPVLHFGLGKRNSVDSLRVTWPDGKTQIQRNISTNTRIELSYDDAKTIADERIPKKPTLLQKADGTVSRMVHKENAYVDFMDQPLLLKMLSREGPGLAVGDVDGDGREDLFMSTALKDTSYIWNRAKDGTFKKGPALPQSWKYEQQGSILADFNADGRPDLYVASGGNELPYESGNYQDQLYMQQPDGSFEVSGGLPQINSSTATVNASDYDGDGDLDLFVGSRLKPNSYPVVDQSYILQNINGSFKDVTAAVAPEIADIGMVTSALWTDFNNDNAPDLIVVGEWMEITFFENQNGLLKNVTSESGMPGLSGFWNSINGADFDGDGDIDYIVGNFGENTDLTASEEEPLTIVAKDFDNNGKIDPILGCYVNGVNYPVPSRDALISQISSMKGRFRFYKDYGKATFDEVFTKKELQGAIRKEVTSLKTTYLENKGDGKFVHKALPLVAQMAPVYGISIEDLDDDGHLDVLLTGNRTDTETLGGSMNSSKGIVLLGNGKGNFQNTTVDVSGFYTLGDARGTAQLVTNEGVDFLVANNDGVMQCFTKKSPKKTILLKQNDTYAEVTLTDGTSYRQEFYFGSGYLTQNSRKLQVPDTAMEIIIFDSQNASRQGLNKK
ncbi:Repeat domain-containing protein [Pricia antarctica]|uniref:Repeat domain-containing protein n=2 Tax=Pricia antarctica TaxID=641691 RepID=A0A1G7AJE4_9FLAO|nr:Repeat domain-containing protein [Pricia antarctica]